MHNGVLVEEGRPYELLEYSSQFKSLVEESNEFDEIYEIARKSYNFKIWIAWNILLLYLYKIHPLLKTIYSI